MLFPAAPSAPVWPRIAALLGLLLTSGCGALTAGLDLGAVAERSDEFDGYVESYNRANDATLVRDLGSLSTRAGFHGALGFGLVGAHYGTALRLGVDQGQRRATSRFEDGSERRMKLRFASFFTEADAGLAHGPRAVVGLDVRNTYLSALTFDINETDTSNPPRLCTTRTDPSGVTCTTGRFATLTGAVYAGATTIVRLRGASGVRVTLTRPVYEIGTTTEGFLKVYSDDYRVPDYGFPRSVDDASPDRHRAVPALLRPWTLRLAFSLNGQE